MKFTRIGRKTKKLWLLIIPALRQSHQPRLGQPKKGVNRNFSRPHLDKAYVVGKLSISEAKICSFSMFGQKINKITALLIFLPENLEKFSSTDLYDASLEGSTTFLYHSSTGRTPLDSCRLAELKYAILSRTRRDTKKLRRSNLFPLMIFKHGLLEGSTLLFQHSSTSCRPFKALD